jgi:hypothetical protein
MTRVPYPERPDVIARWCICPPGVLYDLVEVHDDGSETRTPIRVWDAECKIHGLNEAHELPKGI